MLLNTAEETADPGRARQVLTIGFASSAYNEAENLEEFHQRCRRAHALLADEFADRFELAFRLVIADNGSKDASPAVLAALSGRDDGVVALANRRNYGPEASVVNAVNQARDCDLIAILCSDLQDPPELISAMAKQLLEQRYIDAVLAVKKRSAGGPLLRVARRTYYQILGYSSRLQVVPHGFHGFGCYRSAVIDDAMELWDHTDLNFRQCLVNAAHAPELMDYEQANRVRGVSSYGRWGYWSEALRALLSGDAAASRLALAIGSGGLVLAVLLAVLLLANFLHGNSGYGGGVPTLMGLMLVSFAIQMLMFAVLSRQIESLRMGGFRPKVMFRRIEP